MTPTLDELLRAEWRSEMKFGAAPRCVVSAAGFELCEAAPEIARFIAAAPAMARLLLAALNRGTPHGVLSLDAIREVLAAAGIEVER